MAPIQHVLTIAPPPPPPPPPRFASYRHFNAFWLHQVEPVSRRIVRVGQSSSTTVPDETADPPRRPVSRPSGFLFVYVVNREQHQPPRTQSVQPPAF